MGRPRGRQRPQTLDTETMPGTPCRGQHYRGRPVNHQFDKAFPFELAAHQYIQRFIALGGGPGLTAHPCHALEHRLPIQSKVVFGKRVSGCFSMLK